MVERIRRLFHVVSRVWAFFSRDGVQRMIVFIGILFIVLSSSSAFAQAPTVPSCIDPALAYMNVKSSKETAGFDSTVNDNLDNSGNEISSALTMALFSLEPSLGCNYQTMLEKFPDLDPIARRGLVGTINDANYAMVYNPPSTDVVAHLANEWVPGYEASYTAVYAQDGYDLLSSINIIDLWERMRLISYTLFIIALIVSGFMIMFRHNIGGQMAVTVFNTIPRIIIGLILVTFSFAIVGVIIDLGAMVTTVFAGILGIGNPIVVGNPFSLMWVVFRGTDGIGVVGTAWKGLATVGIGMIGVGSIMALLTMGLAGGVAVGGIITLGVALAFIALFGYASIKVFITLLKAYIGIVVDTILAPIYLFAAVLPGKTAIGTDWFYRLVKNSLTFSVVFLILNLAVYFVNAGVDLRFPPSLAGGNISTSPSGGIVGLVLQSIIPLFFFFAAAEAPTFIADLLPPPSGGKGSAGAFGNVQKSFGKVPVIGGFFG